MSHKDMIQSTKAIEQLFARLDAARMRSDYLSPLSVLQTAAKEGIALSDDLINVLVAKMGSHGGSVLIPSYVLSFISDFTRKISAKKVLDVWASLGTLIRGVSSVKSVEKATGIIRREEEYKTARLIQGTGKEEFILADPDAWLQNQRSEFDLILGFLLTGMPRQEVELEAPTEKVVVADESGFLLLLRAVSRLTDHGSAAFIVPPHFACEKGDKSVRVNLSKFNVFLNGLIFFRPGVFAPIVNAPGYVALISRTRKDKLFVAELSEIPERNKAILNFFFSGNEGRDPLLGRWVAPEGFRGWEEHRSELEIATWLSKTGFSRAKINDVAIEVRTAGVGRPFEDRPNAVYLPTLGTSEAVTARSEFKIREHNYLQLVVDPAKVEPRFLAWFFNSPKGREIRRTFLSGRIIPKLTKSSIGGAPIYFPPKSTQLGILDLETRIRNLENQLTELRSKLSEEPAKVDEITETLSSLEREENFDDWIEQLPFPLATILWHYHVRNEDPRRRYEQLLHFFEALSEFLATILISGFRSDGACYKQIKDDFRCYLREGSFRTSTFATWTLVAEKLTAVGRRALKEWQGAGKEKEIPDRLLGFKTNNVAFLEMIFSERLLDILRRANAYRNVWLGHSGAVDKVEADERRVQLEALLSEARAVMGRGWANYPMIRPTTLRFSYGVFQITVERLMGVRTPFVVQEVEAAEPLDDQKLYFFDHATGRGLELAPLIKVLASPRSAQNACYFYNRSDSEGVRFISYYFGSDSEIVDSFPDTRELILDLLP